MNVPNLKVTMFLTDVYGVGWQESHYRVDAFDPTQPLSKYVNAGILLAQKRAACLHALFYSLTDVRLSYDDVFRDSYLLKANDIPQPTGTGSARKYDNGYATGGGGYQTVQSAIPMILSMRAFKKRAISYLSGFTDGVAQHIRGASPSPNAYAAFQAYGRFLCALDDFDNPTTAESVWGTKIALPEKPIGTNLAPIAASAISYIPRVGNKGTILHINSAALLDSNYVTGNSVYLAGWAITTTQPRIRINGTYEIIARGHDPAPVDKDYVEIIKPTMFVSPSSTSLGTIVGSNAYVLPYQNYTFRNATHHSRGKPSFEPRGRR